MRRIGQSIARATTPRARPIVAVRAECVIAVRGCATFRTGVIKPIDCSTSVCWIALGAILGLVSGCETEGGDDGEAPACIELDKMDCTPLYEPTYANVFAQTIQPRCGVSGSACHGQDDAAGAGGGFVVTDAAATHAALLDGGFVEASDPGRHRGLSP